MSRPSLFNRLKKRTIAGIENRVKAIPAVNRRLEARYEAMLAEMETSLKPYRDEFTAYDQLPTAGRDRKEILADMRALQEKEAARWRDGYASGAVYHGDSAHVDFLNEVYALHSQSNPLHADLWPSATKFEAEIVAMTARMLGAGQTMSGYDVDPTICGTVTSGGTESILLAMKTYRDRGRAAKGIIRPEVILPVTAHAAFDKAAGYFDIKLVRLPVDPQYQADWTGLDDLINPNTIAIVASAPSFPHGVVDPIEAMSTLALKRGIGFHVDACLGGFLLPWARQLGYEVPSFDFRLPGVTSMSVDTHKYGYAAKGTSVVLYRGFDLRRYQYFTITDWPGGLYYSPTFAGSRPGALSAAAWAAMVSLGEDGYRAAADKILAVSTEIRAGIAAIPELRLLGQSLFVHAFTSDELDIYRVLEVMSARGWNLNGLHKPSCVHLCVTLRHTQPGVAARFLADLRAAVAEVKANPKEKGQMAPVYGLAANVPTRGVVKDILERHLDLLYKV